MFESQETQNPIDIDPVNQWCMEHVEPTDTFIDCGAHVGRASISVIQAKKPKLSILLEAVPESVALLRQNLKDVKEKYIVVDRVVYAEKTMIPFTIPVGSNIQSSMFDRFTRNNEEVITTQRETTTLDDVLNEHNVTGDIVMKIDVELAEWHVWRGMQDHVEQFRDICIEWMPTQMRRVGIDPHTFLKDVINNGMEVYRMDGSKPSRIDLWSPRGGKVDLYFKRL